jgi:BlaI family transcriptional regulator, penicillinase repressor
MLDLPRRERQVLEAVIRLGMAGVREVREELPNPPSYSGVRAILRILVEKGRVSFQPVEGRYVYFAAAPIEGTREEAIEHLSAMLFEGSVDAVVEALLSRLPLRQRARVRAWLQPSGRARFHVVVRRKVRQG